MSHECIKSYMTIKTEEKTKRKLSFTKLNSKHTENINEQGFWLLKFVLPCLGNHGEKNKHDHQHTSKIIDIFCREVHSFFHLFIFQKIICAISVKSCCLQWHRGSHHSHQTLTGDSPACFSLFVYCQGSVFTVRLGYCNCKCKSTHNWAVSSCRELLWVYRRSITLTTVNYVMSRD